MKISLIILLSIIFVFSAKTQYSVSPNATIEASDLAVSINTSTANANISILIGEYLNNRDFSIGFTEIRSESDIIILENSLESDLIIVKSRLGESDLSVVYGESMINPDLRIEIVESGTVDFLVFLESESFNIESLILGLLPIINASLGYKYEVIPYWGPEGGPIVQEEPEQQIVQPTYYAGTNLAHWITSIENGVIQLEDNSMFYVYDDDRYMSDLWQKMNDVIVQPTEVIGHYYISKNGGISKEAETLRAICVKAK